MTADLTYRLGTALIAGEPQVVVERGASIATLGSLVGPNAPAGMLELIADWSAWAPAVERALAATNVPSLNPDELQWCPPLIPRKVICIGANYADHNAEMLGKFEASFPFSFLKPPTTTLVGHRHTVTLPRYARKIDYEVELAVVIGRTLREPAPGESLGAIFGYSVLNDLSARDWVTEPTPLGLDWVMGKGFDGSAPIGPWITPAQFVPSPQDLWLRLWVNDDLKQDGHTSTMVFGVEELLDHLASVMTLEPGDVIGTGTPDGVGFGRSPQEFLRAGDEVRASVEGLGTLETSFAGCSGDLDNRRRRQRWST